MGLTLMAVNTPTTIQIVPRTVYLSNMVLQVNGVGTNYVTYQKPLWALTGPVMPESYCGNVMELSWISQSNRVYFLQVSADVVHWQEIPVRFIGDGTAIKFYQGGDPVRSFFRLRIQ